MKNRLILDLCSGSGAWSTHYKDAGYDVREITLPEDVRLVKYVGKVHGLLMAPPCTVFARSGAWVKRSKEEWLEAISVVDACLRFVTICEPEWWCLENPVGMLRQYIGPPKFYFHPHDFGDPWKKKTCLWGNFNIPEKTPVEPTMGSYVCDHIPGRDKHKRAITPPGFSRQFFLANP